jgi:hypothetical protein
MVSSWSKGLLVLKVNSFLVGVLGFWNTLIGLVSICML